MTSSDESFSLQDNAQVEAKASTNYKSIKVVSLSRNKPPTITCS